MNSILVIPSTGSPNKLRMALESVVNSDYKGALVVPCNNEASMEVAASYGVDLYIEGNHPTDHMIWAGATAHREDHDLLIYMHSDAVLPSEWYRRLVDIWGVVDHSIVGAICLPYYMHDPNVRNNSEYTSDINNLSFSDISKKWDHIRMDIPTVTNTPEQLVGLGYDFFNTNDKGKRYCGRYTPCSSILYRDYSDMVAKYTSNTNFNSELLLMRDYLYEGKLLTWGNINPVFHALAQDSFGMSDVFFNFAVDSYQKWFDLFGYNVEHFISTWMGIVQPERMVELIDAINTGDHSTIDAICKEGIKLLEGLECKDCKVSGMCNGNGKKYQAII